MDPSVVGDAILGALAAGALDGAKDVGKSALADAYAALRNAIKRKYAHREEVTEALEKVERKPKSAGYAQVLAEELQSSGASGDQELVLQASKLLELVSSLAGDSNGGQIAHGNNIAQADRQSTASVTIHHRTE
jgi:hypothetical protein